MSNRPSRRADSAPGVPAANVNDSGIHIIHAYFGICAAVLAIIAAIVVIAKAFQSKDVPTIVSEQLLTVATLNLLLFIAIVYSAFSYASRQRRLRRLAVVNAELEATIRSERDAVSFERQKDVRIAQHRADIARAHSEYCMRLQDHMVIEQESDLAGDFNSYLDQVLTNTASIFTAYTGDNSSACIKIFSTDPRIRQRPKEGYGRNPPYVFTLRRDIISASARKVVDTKYPVYRYSDNAAFRAILDDDQRPDFFVCNDLKGQGAAYFTANKEFEKYYNASIVVPIERHGMLVNQKCTALLCVDNVKGGFDEERCLHILNGIAIDVYYSLWTTSRILEPRNENGEV